MFVLCNTEHPQWSCRWLLQREQYKKDTFWDVVIVFIGSRCSSWFPRIHVFLTFRGDQVM